MKKKLFFYCREQSDFVYECRANSFNYSNIYISAWKSTGILNYPTTNSMNAFTNSKIKLPSLISNISPRVYLEGNYFKQKKVKISNINIINIYCVYELKEINSSRNNEFTIQNALFGVVKINKNTDTAKNKYEGYSTCFDGSKTFTHTQKEGNSSYSALARNVIIFGADMSFSKHANNKQIIFMLWAKIIFKKLMILQYMQKKIFIQALQEQKKKLY